PRKYDRTLDDEESRLDGGVRGGEGHEQGSDPPGGEAPIGRHRNGQVDMGDRSVRERRQPRRRHDDAEGHEDGDPRDARDWKSHGSSTTSRPRPRRRRMPGSSGAYRFDAGANTTGRGTGPGATGSA